MIRFKLEGNKNLFLSCETSFKLFMTESKKLCIMFQVELITDTDFLLPHIFTASSIYHFQIINYFLILGSVDGVQKTIEFQSLINAADQFSFSQQIFYTEFQLIIWLTQSFTLVQKSKFLQLETKPDNIWGQIIEKHIHKKIQ